jgi:prolipoprotein diacylglyceryltransferase
MFPILQLGPLAIQVPGLVLLVGLWVAIAQAEREAKRLTMNSDQIYNLIYVALIAGLIGARLAYVLRFANAYLADPWGIVSLNSATLAVPEGVGLALVAAWAYGARARLPFQPTLEVFAPALAILLIALALAHLASGDAFGAPTDLPWRVYLWGDYRHPSQVYELMGALLVYGLWWRLREHAPYAGFSFLLVVAGASLVAVGLEAFRGDSALTVAGLRVTQVTGAGLLAISLGLMQWWLHGLDRSAGAS